MELKGQIAIITGGASGLGAATARLLAEKGVKVAILDIHSNLNHFASEIKALGFTTDVTDSASIESALDEIESKWGVPTICINCAGILGAGRMVGREGPMSLEYFQKVVDVNLVGTFNVCRLFASRILKNRFQNGQLQNDRSQNNQSQTIQSQNNHSQNNNPIDESGVIINTASIAAFEGQIGQVAYSASKGGVVSMTLPLAREFAKSGIRVMAVAPGLIETPMMHNLSEDAQKRLKASSIFPNRLGKSEEFAALVVHIIENPLLNGAMIRLDGGIRLS